MTLAVRVESLSKIYYSGWRKKSKQAICDVSFSIAEGEAFGFIGPNGAGKSTTLKILTGLQKATSGNAWLYGLPVADPSARKRMGYVPENPYLFDYLTPLEILQMGIRLHALQVDDEKKHCLKWLERFDLAEVANKTIRSFSKGMTQRVALAQAMAIQPRLLILDEPLSGLDPIGRRLVVDVLAEFKQQGGSLLFTSHVLHDVEHLADRFGMIHQGRIRTESSPAQLIGEDDVVLIRSQGTLPVDGMAPESAGQWSGSVARGQTWQMLNNLQSAGHILLEVKPTLTLENVFMRIVKSPNSEGAV